MWPPSYARRDAGKLICNLLLTNVTEDEHFGLCCGFTILLLGTISCYCLVLLRHSWPQKAQDPSFLNLLTGLWFRNDVASAVSILIWSPVATSSIIANWCSWAFKAMDSRDLGNEIEVVKCCKLPFLSCHGFMLLLKGIVQQNGLHFQAGFTPCLNISIVNYNTWWSRCHALELCTSRKKMASKNSARHPGGNISPLMSSLINI